jgi:diguanylate cyclase (GGDEF)-like protein
VDRLTGLADAREFFASLPALAAQDRLSLVLFDIDNLRSLNNEQGEENVDRLLARLGTLLRERCGSGETAARVGGDEFALSLLENEPTEVVAEVERIRRGFQEEASGATLSVGICDTATFRRGSGSLTLFEAAEDALVEAKKQGPAGLTIYRPQD